MIPESLQVQNRAPVTTSLTEGQLLQSLLNQELWGGISLARKIDERWSLGVTAWAIQRTAVEMVSLRVLIPSSANTVATSSSRKSINVVVGSVTAGVGYEATKTTRLGLRVQSPSFQLYGKADSYVARDDINAGVLTSTVEDRRNLKGYFKLPLDLTFGVSQEVGAVELFLDLSLQFPVAYAETPELSEQNSFDTKLTPRGSLGMDWKMSKDWSLRSGVSYNPSALRKLEIGSSESQIDLWGGTLGLLWRAGQIETSGGVFFVKGSGKSAPVSGTDFSDARITGYGAVLASSYLF
jgi:long-subunit fatty acid transport protein